MIFVSVASYRDPFLRTTLIDAWNNAKYRDQIVFGVVDQCFETDTLDLGSLPFREQVRYIRVDPVYARGVCWARSLVQTLYHGEDYYFQIDAHTLFDSDWDQTLIEQYQHLRQHHEKPVITAYPHSFSTSGNDLDQHHKTKFPGVLVLIPNSEDAFRSSYYVGGKTHIYDSDSAPKHGFLVAGGFLFTDGSVVEQVPYDPYLYVSGEENSLALRLWTHGYNIFHVADIPIYHYYGTVNRVTPWSDEMTESVARPVRWFVHDQRSKQRLADIVLGINKGIYGLGRQRSLTSYMKVSGIDYFGRKLDFDSPATNPLFELDYTLPINI
jgi:Glycosyltransferase (GlcNAc)